MDWREEQYILQNIKTMSLERLKYFIFSFCPWRKQAQKQKTKTVVGSQKKVYFTLQDFLLAAATCNR